MKASLRDAKERASYIKKRQRERALASIQSVIFEQVPINKVNVGFKIMF